MLAGGVLFLGGAVLYLPAWASHEAKLGAWVGTVGTVGTWVFRIGTICYLCGSFGTLWSSLPAALAQTNPDRASSRNTVIGTFAYIIGALFYFAGGVLTQAGRSGLSADTWVIGSFFFVGGSVIFLRGALNARDDAAYTHETGSSERKSEPLLLSGLEHAGSSAE
jgi:hypothetical protein